MKRLERLVKERFKTDRRGRIKPGVFKRPSFEEIQERNKDPLTKGTDDAMRELIEKEILK